MDYKEFLYVFEFVRILSDPLILTQVLSFA